MAYHLQRMSLCKMSPFGSKHIKTYKIKQQQQQQAEAKIFFLKIWFYMNKKAFPCFTFVENSPSYPTFSRLELPGSSAQAGRCPTDEHHLLSPLPSLTLMS